MREAGWDLMAVVPDSAADEMLDLATVWRKLRDLRRMRIEVIPMRWRDFDEDRTIHGELAREGHVRPPRRA